MKPSRTQASSIQKTQEKGRQRGSRSNPLPLRSRRPQEIVLAVLIVVLLIYNFALQVRLTYQEKRVSQSWTLQQSKKHTKMSSPPKPERSVHLQRLHDIDDDGIRTWGCDLSITPLIFVHIGKCAGGTVRARFSAVRPGFPYHQDWRRPDDKYTYAVRVENDERTGKTAVEEAYFCNSAHSNFRVTPRKLYEKTLLCHATTPIGAALACPDHVAAVSWLCGPGCGPHATSCRQVYVGHNLMGSEMHWLPPPMLRQWFQENTSWMSDNSPDAALQIANGWSRLEPNKNVSWCPNQGYARPSTRDEYEDFSHACGVPLAAHWDKMANQLLWTTPQTMTLTSSSPPPSNIDDINWGALYSSLPVLRVTLVRDPFNWLVSKFFWHGNGRYGLKCDDIATAVGFPASQEHLLNTTKRRGLQHRRLEGQARRGDGGPLTMPPFHADSTVINDHAGYAWAHRYCMLYLFYLCGEDCAGRMEMGVGNLAQIEAQSIYNLRQSFAVVGLWNETDSFFDMVDARIQYIDMSLNPNTTGEQHSSGKFFKPIVRCHSRFADPTFRAQLRIACPALAALERVYNVALQVNHRHMQELASCAKTSPEIRQRLRAKIEERGWW